MDRTTPRFSTRACDEFSGPANGSFGPDLDAAHFLRDVSSRQPSLNVSSLGGDFIPINITIDAFAAAPVSTFGKTQSHPGTIKVTGRDDDFKGRATPVTLVALECRGILLWITTVWYCSDLATRAFACTVAVRFHRIID